MDTLSLTQLPHSTAFLGALSELDLRQRVPSAFAPSAHESRLSHTRRITAIKEDVRLNSGLWDMALARAA